MSPKWQKLASLAQEICTLWFQFFGAVFASEGYPFKNIFAYKNGQKKSFKENDSFFINKIIGSTLELSAKSFLIGQVPIKKYGLKTLFLLFNI